MWKIYSLIIPVLRTMEHCKMNCGADSKKASMMLELKTSFLIIEIISWFPGRLVSKKKRPKKDLKFLEKCNFVKL
jgi:hypothetical protein